MASHEFVPPDTLEPVIHKIADEFVTGGVSFEVLQAGYSLSHPFPNVDSIQFGKFAPVPHSL
jgi:hypothetical protein